MKTAKIDSWEQVFTIYVDCPYCKINQLIDDYDEPTSSVTSVCYSCGKEFWINLPAEKKRRGKKT